MYKLGVQSLIFCISIVLQINMTHQAAESATLGVPLTKRDMYLDELGIGVTGTIVFMVCRVWDVTAVTGRYLSTDFIVYDSKPNKDQYRIIKTGSFMLELDGTTTTRKVYVKADGFDRYAFQLTDVASVEPTDNKYLIDVAGYVTNVGRSIQQKSGSRTIDFYLANQR
ncbi:hypothetical protein OROHE_003557 [Orobanche hederae]